MELQTHVELAQQAYTLFQKIKKRIFDAQEFTDMLHDWELKGYVSPSQKENALLSAESEEIKELIALMIKIEASMTVLKVFVTYPTTATLSIKNPINTPIYLILQYMFEHLAIGAFTSLYIHSTSIRNKLGIILGETLTPTVHRFIPLYVVMESHKDFVECFCAYQKAKNIHRKNKISETPNTELERARFDQGQKIASIIGSPFSIISYVKNSILEKTSSAIEWIKCSNNKK